MAVAFRQKHRRGCEGSGRQESKVRSVSDPAATRENRARSFQSVDRSNRYVRVYRLHQYDCWSDLLPPISVVATGIIGVGVTCADTMNPSRPRC